MRDKNHFHVVRLISKISEIWPPRIEIIEHSEEQRSKDLPPTIQSKPSNKKSSGRRSGSTYILEPVLILVYILMLALNIQNFMWCYSLFVGGITDTLNKMYLNSDEYAEIKYNATITYDIFKNNRMEFGKQGLGQLWPEIGDPSPTLSHGKIDNYDFTVLTTRLKLHVGPFGRETSLNYLKYNEVFTGEE
ncbi:MAG: hypothetical protein NZM04_02615 [Methylacidiphilales bacterium]|nr:hypothetical protein [Candidatus Methylacidiphilales bacterium]